ncbi:MAG: hypothetical protein OHK0011_25650 [Turneriella sp.]
MNSLIRFSAIVLLSAAAIVAAPKKKETKAPSAEAARVAILLYSDKTGTKNFEYMPGSLKEAITNSMHEKFEFNEVDTAKVDPIVSQVRNKNKGVIGAKEAAEICRQADIDILIYGDFTFNTGANQLEIHTNISLGSTDKFRVLPAVENRVDSTIFQAADKVATDIVAEITRIAREQQEARGKAAEAEQNKKTQLEKTEKRKTWADINWNFALGMGIINPLISRDNAVVRVEPAANIYGMYRLKGNWHVGLFAAYSAFRSNTSNSPYETNIEYIASTANVGYYFDLSARWRLTTMLGAGYFIGRYSVYAKCSPGSTQCFAPNTVPETPIRNPFFLARSGIHFLIFSFLSAGVEAEYRMLYDGKPIHAVGGYGTLTLAF